MRPSLLALRTRSRYLVVLSREPASREASVGCARAWSGETASSGEEAEAEAEAEEDGEEEEVEEEEEGAAPAASNGLGCRLR